MTSEQREWYTETIKSIDTYMKAYAMYVKCAASNIKEILEGISKYYEDPKA
jgi:predicted transcriptional regulator with HTH domain